jgi:hypothetical protein
MLIVRLLLGENHSAAGLASCESVLIEANTPSRRLAPMDDTHEEREPEVVQ